MTAAVPYLTSEIRSRKVLEWKAQLQKSARVRTRIPFNIVRSALLWVDPINCFTHAQGSAYLPSSPVVMEGSLALMEAFLRAGRPVIIAAHCHSGDPGLFSMFYRTHIACGTFNAQVHASVPTAPLARVIRKQTYDSFHNTELTDILTQNNCDQVMICGVLTHLCVESTARGAFSRGIIPFVVMDATCTRSEALHLASLISMSDACAVPLTLEEALLHVP
ncbi:cysteine hydrolase [Myxococcota bacterium]|nr:cysteine hydrolase [Myxococcota bacterium]MBU1537527.1 cysteine hydrolase [Myxococcota bacterium]